MPSGGSTRSTAPLAIALCGMPGCCADCFVLRERDAAGGLDLADAQRAVRARARQNDADRGRPLDRRERAQEMIDRVMRAPIVGTRRHGEHTVGDRDAGVGLNDVDVVRRDLGAVGGIDDRHRGVRLQQLGQTTLMFGIEVLDDHQRQARSRWQRVEEMREGTEASGRGTDADDRKGMLSGGLGHSSEYKCPLVVWAKVRVPLSSAQPCEPVGVAA